MRIALALLSFLLVAGCGQHGFTGMYNAPLPGGADLGDDPYRVTAQLADVLDLVPQAGVKVNDVAVGRVSGIRLAPDGWTAEVTLEINRDVRLPASAVAQLRQSSLLGEKYVQLDGSTTPGSALLSDGDHIPLSRTNRHPQVEEVLGALSMLLNGGGIGQLQQINQELGAALSGNEADIRSLHRNLEVFTRELDGQRDEITRAIDGLNRLAASLVGQKQNIVFALDNLGPGLKVINEQRGQLVAMLQQMDRLSEIAVETTERSKQDTLANLRSLSPVLRQLAAAGEDIPKSLEILVTFPFTDYTANAIKGDYTNLDLQLDLDLSTVVDNVLQGRPPPTGGIGPGEPPLPLPAPATPAPGAPPPPRPGGPFDAVLGGAR
ncbi:MCE family protein [Saccharopolyspora dendranthemae]|uniref:Phospholipid/cholesterol/gamma-HCH transport system substrate-binding protein n=1 Tax=Saccharopolyspora dendranthemae TaxID=1181886 RepID=A0A561U7G0_9PSEU|nr:MCE family protein [Saccharopolyspora dendranthemae]TWF95300.1 phospholipid/cholesterol/gamma-HCH transport system substrate-binding protein [Saccharopolyspora dendranthemae]